MKRLVVIACAALLLIIVLVSLRQPRSTEVVAVQPTNLVVTFLGFTNSIGGPQAIFYFTNGTLLSQHFQVTSLDYMTQDGWESAAETLRNRLVGSLNSGMGYSWPVDVDNTNTAWRVRISVVERATGVDGLVDRGKEYVYEIRKGRPLRRFTGRTYDIVSVEAER